MLNRLAVLTLIAALAPAAVHRISVKERTPLAGGASLGSAGPYERIVGTVHFRLDPKLPQNESIVDLELAPRNSDGLVEFTSDVLILAPRDPKKSNGTALVDIPNRGRLLVVSRFNQAPSTPDPKTREDLGDAFLMDRGFTVVSIGWQWDVPDEPGRIGLQAPRLPDSITGLVRSEFVPDASVKGFPLGDRDHVPYPVADEQHPDNRLYVSDAPRKPRRLIPRNRWRFVNGTAVEIDGGCEPGKIYEVVYRAKGAVPAGVGFAAVRDIASYLKDPKSPPLDGQQLSVERTIAYGVSQTGRFLRHMMYQAFNEDEQGRKALDGVWSQVAGAGRGGFNHRFAQPSRDGQPLLHYSWPVDLFPFADAELKDPLTGQSGGLLTRVKASGAAPKIFYTNNSYEYWGRAASLIHTTVDGKRDVAPDENTRIYFFAGAQHGNGTLPLRRTNTQNTQNPLDLHWPMRALLLAFHEWLKDGTPPPESVYPKISAGELVEPAKVKYPKHVKPPQWLRLPPVLDFGPDFEKKGIVTIEPPKEGREYPVLVPQVDADGNELGGIRVVELEVPLGIYTGWNLRGASAGASDRMIAFTGSFIPYDEGEIRKRHDTRQAYLERVRASARNLVGKRLALESDVDGIVDRAAQLWDAMKLPSR